MSDHEPFREMLARRSELALPEESRLRAHLQDCPECRSLADDYALQTALLRALPSVSPPPTLRSLVLRSVEASRPSPLPRLRGAAAILAPVAALVAAVVIAFVHQSHHPTSTASAPKSANPTPGVVRHATSPGSAGVSHPVRTTSHPARHSSSASARASQPPSPSSGPEQAPLISAQSLSQPGVTTGQSNGVAAPPAHIAASGVHPSPVASQPTAAPPPAPAPTSVPPAVSTSAPTPPVVVQPVTPPPATITAPSSPPPSPAVPDPTP